MAKQIRSNVVQEARDALEAWTQINQKLTLGELTREALSNNIEEAAWIDSQIVSLEKQLTHLRNQRQASYSAVWDKLKRVRAGIKAIYGDDSSQYEIIGGTRVSERKARTRTSATPIQ